MTQDIGRELNHQRDIRSNLYGRVKKLRLHLLWERNFKIFLTSRGTMYEVRYDKLHQRRCHYNDLLAFVRLGPEKGNRVCICQLKQDARTPTLYRAKEVAPAFSRMKRRELHIDVNQIAGYLVPCSTK